MAHVTVQFDRQMEGSFAMFLSCDELKEKVAEYLQMNPNLFSATLNPNTCMLNIELERFTAEDDMNARNKQNLAHVLDVPEKWIYPISIANKKQV